MISRPRRHGAGRPLATALLILAACGAACNDDVAGGNGAASGAAAPAAPRAASPDALQPVSLPDLAHVEPSVRSQLQNAFDDVTRTRRMADTPMADLARAYGELGRLLLAARMLEHAEPCFVNAQSLATADRRWPYYLGHIYKTQGTIDPAIAAFGRALELEPGDVPTMVWLAEMQLQAGRPASAVPLFSRALEAKAGRLAGRFGLGRAALAERDYTRAVEHLEAALSIEPNATGVHYPLALAYRGLGNTARADAHARLLGQSDVTPADPLMDDVRGLLHSAVTYELTGTRALNAGDWRAAVAEFRKGLELEPSNAALRHKLGTALFVSGDARAARSHFEDVVRDTPTYAKAHYSLGVLLASEGREDEAMVRLSSAVAYEPDYVEAHVSLAELLRKRGNLREAVSRYDRALTLDPRLQEAALGRALTLIRLERYAEAAERLREARVMHPHAPWLAHALARLLAAAPDARVRDGRQALAVMEALSQAEQRLDFGETLSMALAEAGRFADAVASQRAAIDSARQAGRLDQVAGMADRLRLYEAGRPSRRPWRPEELQ